MREGGASAPVAPASRRVAGFSASFSAARVALALLVLMSAVPGCGAETPPPAAPHAGLSAAQRQMADQIISVFENDSPVLQYGYAEDIGDGRGITAGRAGFTSATGDLLLVVERYAAAAPGNALAPYIPRLEELAAAESDATDGLEGLADAWSEAAGDPVFRGIQDAVVDEEYFDPAVRHGQELGLSTALSVLCLYDTAIQHGDGDDPDGLPAIIARATSQAGGAPGGDVSEERYLRAFLEVRRAVLSHASNPDTREAWAESTARVDTLVGLLEAGNLQLTPPIIIAPWGTTHSLFD